MGKVKERVMKEDYVEELRVEMEKIKKQKDYYKNALNYIKELGPYNGWKIIGFVKEVLEKYSD